MLQVIFSSVNIYQKTADQASLKATTLLYEGLDEFTYSLHNWLRVILQDVLLGPNFVD